MADLWYAILAFTVIGYVVLDGRNLGAGALMPWIARDERERSAVIKAIGPLWTWHEVWLLATGGVLFVAFPRVLATALSGFYLAVFLLLWCFIGRGISLEVSSHLDDRLWRRFFHTVFALSSAALAVLLGATVGNLVRGVPLQPGEPFMLPLFVDFGASLPNGILDWYTLSTGVLGLVMLAAHGASSIVARLEGPMQARTRRAARWLWLVGGVLLAGVTIGTLQVRPDLMAAIFSRPLGLAATAAVAIAAALLVRSLRAGNLFWPSHVILAGLLIGLAAGTFPVLLYSTADPAGTLTTANAAAAEYGLVKAAAWWPIAALLSIGYAVFVARYYRRGTESLSDSHGPY